MTTGAPVRVGTGEDDTLTALRRWVCDLPEGAAEVPCGGTHVDRLDRPGPVTVTYTLVDDGAGFEARTRVAPAG